MASVGTPTAATAQSAMPALVRLLRPRQWIKNAFVLAPLLFSGSFLDRSAAVRALVATAVFCLASAATYVFNDLLDLENDRRHPVKRLTRPIASGAIQQRTAWTVLVILWAAVLAAVAVAGWQVIAVTAGYVGLNVLYSWRLKTIPVVDLFALAAGFVLRVFAGAVAIHVVLSSWMLITTLSLAIYLAAVKRRDELIARGDTARAVLTAYSVPLLSRYADWAAVSAIVFYALFVITVRPALAPSVPVVLFGLFRYAYIVDARGGGESPTDAVWRDRPLLLTVLVWGALCAALLRGGG